MYKSLLQLLWSACILFFTPLLIAQHPVMTPHPDLEKESPSFVLELKRIEIPDHPHAFNGSIVHWSHEGLVMAFREIVEPLNISGTSSGGNSRIGIVRLDADFEPLTPPQFFDTPSGVQDPRLLMIKDSLYLVYSEVHESGALAGICRMYVGQLHFDGREFTLDRSQSLLTFDSEDQIRHEKNWVPFDYKGNLMLAYSLTPHKIYWPFVDQGTCLTVATSNASIDWPWGELRGGTPACAIDDAHYLSFFHSSLDMESQQSMEEIMPHYFMGAYLFKRSFPFTITHISPEPIVAPGFYSGEVYEPYWHPLRVVFPSGFTFDEEYIWVSYGRQDHEIWVAKLDKHKLLNSLIPTPSDL